MGHLQLRHQATAIVADCNISYGQMLRSRDTVGFCSGFSGFYGAFRLRRPFRFCNLTVKMKYRLSRSI